jgi:hypothetical protein
MSNFIINDIGPRFQPCITPMACMQEKASNGQTFWNLSKFSLGESDLGKPAYSSNHWVRFRERIWLCKRKNNDSIREIVGYQIAQAIELPLQPWIAFFHAQKKCEFAHGGCVGILVERWPKFARQCCLTNQAAEHPDLASRALALSVFGSFEWPEWMVDAEQEQLRLFDLERIGPWPERSDVNIYFGSMNESLNTARSAVLDAGIKRTFERHLETLTMLDFSRIIDLSGHPYGDRMKRVIVRGLVARQKTINSRISV